MKLVNLYPENSLVIEIEKVIEEITNSPLQVNADKRLVKKVQLLINDINQFISDPSLENHSNKGILTNSIENSMVKITIQNYSSDKKVVIQSFKKIIKHLKNLQKEEGKSSDFKNSNLSNIIGDPITFIPIIANKSENPKIFFSQVKAMIKDGNTIEAIDKLFNASSKFSDDSNKQIILISTRFKEIIKTEKQSGDTQNTRSSKTKIIASLLDLINDLEKNNLKS